MDMLTGCQERACGRENQNQAADAAKRRPHDRDCEQHEEARESRPQARQEVEDEDVDILSFDLFFGEEAEGAVESSCHGGNQQA